MKRVTILSLALASVALPVVAQSHPARNDEEKVSSSLFVQGDTLGMHEALRQNMPQAYNVPGLPRFAIFGKEGKFYLGIGGQVKVTAGYDLGDVIDDPNCFTTSALPMNGAPGNGGKFQISAQQSSLFVNMVALPGTANQIGAYVSVNFMGENYAPSIVQAYLKYRGITAGYAFSLFSDMAAAPPTIDYEGPNAFTALPHTVLYYEKPFGRKKEWKAGVGVEQPANSFTLATKTLSVNQRVPDIPAYIQYSWNNGKGWLRFSAMLRNLYYRDLITARNVDRVGWGVKASGSTPIVGNLTAYYQAVYGKGISSYIQDLNGMGMDLMPSATDLGKLNPIKAWVHTADCSITSRSRCSALPPTAMCALTSPAMLEPTVHGESNTDMPSMSWPMYSGTSTALYRPEWNIFTVDASTITATSRTITASRRCSLSISNSS